jgi:3-phenylpropionate/trans-cinnamate dioxygenase ferredoxin reductase component
MTRILVVVGAGLCGGAAVQALRGEGFDGRIVMVGAEPHLPYERPPLSKEYLRGEQDRDALFLWPESAYSENDIEVRLETRVLALHPDGPAVELEGGERIDAEGVLLATGGRPLRLGGEPSDRVLTLRTVEDADRIRAALDGAGRLVVVGAGFIGAEVAASARGLGVEVTMLEMLDVPLVRAIGEEMGKVYAAIHRDHGVDLRTGESVKAVEEDSGGVVVRTAGGDAIEGDVVVIGVGIEPNVDLARDAGLEVDDGVVVDGRCRTSAAGVFAAGDVARHDHPLFGPLRVEHYDNALKQGAAAARSMLGRDEVFDDPHWFWSDQYDVNLQVAGFASSWDRTVVRGSIEDLDFAVFFLRDGVLLSVLGVNRGKDVRRAMKLIAARARPDPGSLADQEVDLRTLVPAS